MAQTSTITMFIDNMDPNAQWGASVIAACNSTTTYAIECTSAPLNPACSSGASAITITEGPSLYEATTQAIVSETSATITEVCSVDSSASTAACVQTVVASGYGQNVVTTASFGLGGNNFHQYAVAVTKGVKDLENGGTCKANGKSSGAGNVGVHGTVLIGAVMLACLGMIVVL